MKEEALRKKGELKEAKENLWKRWRDKGENREKKSREKFWEEEKRLGGVEDRIEKLEETL